MRPGNVTKNKTVEVNGQRMLDEFITLASFDSESFHEKDISEYLYKKLIDLGLEVKMDNVGHLIRENEKATGNIYGYLKSNVDSSGGNSAENGDGNDWSESVLFSSHMDTVSPGVGKKVVVHENGRVTSDGTTVLGSDDITGLVAILEMLTVIKENNIPHPDIEVAFFVAEEVYGMGSAHFDYSQVKAKKAYTLDLDGPIGKIANCAPSILQFEATIKGISSHAGFEPEKGISAIVVASEAISKLKLGRIDENTTANVGRISGGTGKNIIPGEVSFEGEVRSLNNDKAHAIVEQIKQEFEQAAAKYGATLSFTSEEMVRAYETDKNSEVIRRYAKVLNELGYGEPEIVTTFGGSDNNNFCKYGIEGIVITNAMNNVHTVNEYFDLDELEKNSRIILGLAIERSL